MSLSAEELEQVARQLAAAPELWRPHVRHCEDSREYELIWDDEDVNAWVICWNPGHDTGFHDHDDAGAAIVVVEGAVREERLRVGAEPESRTLKPGESVHVPATAIHRVLHDGAAQAVTIHVYSPPLRRTGAYEIGPNGVLKRFSQPLEQELAARLA